MPHTISDQTIALAGIYQAVRLVQQVANTGVYDEQDFNTCINSLFIVDADTSEDIFGKESNLSTGLKTLIEQLGGNLEDGNETREKDINITKYAINVMVLEKQLKKNSQMLDKISDGIDRARKQAEHFSTTHDNVIAALAGLYTETISTLRPRIMVHGEQVYLSNPNQANRIRALLLAAVRSAVLWRQYGGTRWQMLFYRRSIIDNAKNLLSG